MDDKAFKTKRGTFFVYFQKFFLINKLKKRGGRKMKKGIKIFHKVGFLFFILNAFALAKTSNGGKTQIFGKLVQWAADSWSDIQIFGTFAGLIAIGWFAFNQMADHETSRTMIKIGSIVLIIVAIWFIEPTVKALGGSTIAIEYIKAIR